MCINKSLVVTIVTFHIMEIEEEQVDINTKNEVDDGVTLLNALRHIKNERHLFMVKVEELTRNFDTEIYKGEMTVLEKEANRLESDRIRFIKSLETTHDIVLKKEQYDNSIIPLVDMNTNDEKKDDIPGIYKLISMQDCKFAITFFSIAGPMELFNLYRTSIFMKDTIIKNISVFLRGIINNYYVQGKGVKFVQDKVYDIVCLLDLYDSCIENKMDTVLPYVPNLLLIVNKFIDLMRLRDRGCGKVELFGYSNRLNSSVFVFNQKKKTIHHLSTLNLFTSTEYQNVLNRVANRIGLHKTIDIKSLFSRNYLLFFNYRELLDLDLKPIKYHKVTNRHNIFIIKNGKLKQLTETNLVLFCIRDVFVEFKNDTDAFQTTIDTRTIDYYSYRLGIIEHAKENNSGDDKYLNMINNSIFPDGKTDNSESKYETNEDKLNQYIMNLYNIFDPMGTSHLLRNTSNNLAIL